MRPSLEVTLLNGEVPGRIVFFAAYPHMYGGNERGLELLATGLRGRGWAVDVLFPSDGEVVERFRAAGIAATLTSLSLTVPEPPPIL